MKIILLQDVKSLGKKGDAKEVSEGYARNFLIPKKLAVIATPSAISKIAEMKKKEKEKNEAEIMRLKELAKRISATKITISAKEKNGKLFGSISPKQIVSELKTAGLNVSTNSIIIKEAIKKIGDHEIEIKLADSISAKAKLEVRSAK